MCGIVGYIGKKKALPILINGLKKLEYRGYDSAGVAYFENKKIKIVKEVGRISNLEKEMDTNSLSNMGIGHTRWATHGKVNEINSHPHKVGKITIVHNGILENYQELKRKLERDNYTFISETDTEVASAYIDYLYKKNNSILKTLRACLKDFVGSYAILLMVDGDDNNLYALKKDSPLIIGVSDTGKYVASDVAAYATEINKYVILEDMEIAVIGRDNLKVYKNNKEKEIIYKKSNKNNDAFENNTYDNYMIKEINEESGLVNKWNNIYLNNLSKIPNLSRFAKIQIVGCGTAYHAGLVGKYLLEMFYDKEINVYIASEYRYQKIYVDEKTLVIFVSQSGETADTLACIKRVKELKGKTLGIVNVYDSSIAREVDKVIYTKAGAEVAVASTKAYLSQIYVFSLLAMVIGLKKERLKLEKIRKSYEKLPKIINELINLDYDNISKKIYDKENIFYLGRNIDYISVLEGSLKLKEISYIHSEAFPSGELKHGTISLISLDTPVIALITRKELANKSISNIKEVKTRGAFVILLLSEDLISFVDESCYDEIIILNKTSDLVQPLVNIIPLQLIAYYTAKRKGCDIDKPRNLAKSVTVE